jgi:DNA-directed RNA polymerase specialized sigma24 family protein
MSINDAGSDWLPETETAVIEAARADGTTGVRGREAFARRYYQPIVAYTRVLARDEERAADLAQGFFAKVFLEGRILGGYRRGGKSDPKRPAFRPYLKQALRNYLIDEVRSGKRRAADVPLGDAFADGDAAPFEPEELLEAERAFHRAWVVEFVGEVLERVAVSSKAGGQETHLALFRDWYFGGADADAARPSWRELGARYALSEKAAHERSRTIERRFLSLLPRVLAGRMRARRGTDAGRNVQRDSQEELAALIGGRKTPGQRPGDTTDQAFDLDMSRIAELLAHDGADDASSVLLFVVARDVVGLSRLLDEIPGGRRERASALLARLASPEVSLDEIEAVKVAAKALVRRAPTPAYEGAAKLLYHAAIAAGLAVHGKNVSTIDAAERLGLYEELASALHPHPLGGVFRRAAERSWAGAAEA